jgi:hypothetical protein
LALSAVFASALAIDQSFFGMDWKLGHGYGNGVRTRKQKRVFG